MLVPLSWLKEYLPLTIPVEQLNEKLTEVGLAVEAIHQEDGDIILELEVTPNRPDCLSILGVAREIAAIEKKQIKFPGVIGGVIGKPKKILPLKIKTDFKINPRFTGIIIDGIKVKESPNWLKERLTKIGQRPINNIVDITNYVMFELGNPLHAFDYDRLKGHYMEVKQAKGGEKFESVDGVSYYLPQGAVVIADQERIIDLCGIKGGLNSGTFEDTKTIFIRVPVEIPTLIRKASQSLGLRSDASSIFEKGVNTGGTVEALKRCVDLVLELAGGEIASELYDLKEKDFKPRKQKLRLESLNKLLGIGVEKEKVLKILESLNFSPEMQSQEIIEATIPTYRNDLQIEEDLIEEIARIYGYNNFPQTLPKAEIPTQPIPYLANYSLSQKTKQLLVGAGYSEVTTYSLVGGNTLKKTGINPEDALKVSNPVSAEYEYLRPSLIPNLLSAILLNQPNFGEIKIFEMGKVYLQKEKKNEEKWYLSGATTEDYYSVKGIIELICQELGIHEVDFKPWVKKDLLFQASRTAVIETPRTVLGTIGEIHHQVLAQLGIKGQVTIFELDFNQVVKMANPQKQYIPIPQYPPIIEDLSFVVLPKTPVGDLIQLIESASSIIQSVQLLDTYKDTRTFRIICQSRQKTLTDKEVAKIREKIIKEAKTKFEAQLKDNS